MARYPRDVFPNGALQGILNTWRTYLAKTSSFWMHGGNILPREGVFSVRGPFGNAPRRNIAMTCHQGCTTARSRPGSRLSVHANTQRRFLARLHPMLTRKRGCRTKKEDRMMRSSYLLVNQSQSDIQANQSQSDIRINRSRFDIWVP